MKTSNCKPNFKRLLFVVLFLNFTLALFAQQPATVRDSTSTTFSFGKLDTPNPGSIESKYTYDPLSDRYFYTSTVGNFNINYPVILSPKEFQELVLKESLKSYYKEKLDAIDGKKEGLEEAKKNLIPDLYVNSKFFETIFGSNVISVVPQGSVEIDLGAMYTKQENPAFSPRNQSNFTFDFDQRISLSLTGKVGTRLNVNANYDTQSTFDFQNLFKIEYTPLNNPEELLGEKGKKLLNKGRQLEGQGRQLLENPKGAANSLAQKQLNKLNSDNEDSILQKLELGNVSMPLNSSLITGAQSLFGVKTELQFGKTRVTAVFSEQQSETRSVTSQGGGTLEDFEFFGLDYDENRHFFLGQYFRSAYDEALKNYPFIQSQVQITRIEVWVTNRTNRIDNVRNIVALQDLGESSVIGLNTIPSGFVNAGPNAYPDNGNNNFDPTTIGSGSLLTEAVRDIATVESGFSSIDVGEGFDYGKLENARKLTEGNEFTVDTQLGYISLNQRLQNDEILAVAYQFTVGEKVFQVGEFANDGVNATDSSVNATTGNTTVTNKSLVLKMLKSAVTNVKLPIWDLMMKNIYNTGAYQLSQDDFRLNIFYNETSALNFITPVGTTEFPAPTGNNDPIEETPLIRLFNFDRLNFNNDPQNKGDGFFDFVPGITVVPQNGKIVFTKVEPFGSFLFETLRNESSEDYEGDETTFNDNQKKYVYRSLYKNTKTAALQESDKNKFLMRGRYKSSGSSGIPIGAFNVPRGSVKVTAGGRVLVEGVDYTVNYQIGTVQILDPSLQASNTPIEVSVENNAVFGQQTKRFTGFNVEHQFNENFVLGATFLNLNERPITQKANLGTESINNSIFGFNGNYSTEVPFLTRLVNKLPNIDTDVASNLSLRGEFAYLRPGAPKGTDFDSEVTSYIDDFEGSQNGISLLSPQSWALSSRPLNLGRSYAEDVKGYQNGFDRALLNWYSIDPIFYSNQRPEGISDDDISDLYTRRIFIDELFPQVDLVTGQFTAISSLDLVYNPEERGPYNYKSDAVDGVLTTPRDSWAGITRQLTTTDFEQSNVEYVEFWLMDPFLKNPSSSGGKLVLNLGNISEDVIKDGKKQYENGLPEDGDISILQPSPWGTVTPQNQSLIYAFSSQGDSRSNQDVGLDGYDDLEEKNVLDENGNRDSRFADFKDLDDPANDNYKYYLNTEGDIFDRYKRYNGLEGNSPDAFSETNRGSTTLPDVEDINRDNTMNTIDSYFEYEINITPSELSNPTASFIVDRKSVSNITLPNGSSSGVINWYQYRIPLSEFTSDADENPSDFRSIRFARLYLKDFTEKTVLRFGTLDLVRSDWRRYQLSLDDESNQATEEDPTVFSVGIVGIQENDGGYESPPGVVREQLNNNNTIVRQNEQSLVVDVCDLESKDARGVFKNINVDMRQYKKLKMFVHAENGETDGFEEGSLVAFIRMGNDFTQNYYQIEVPLRKSSGAAPSQVWPEENEIDIPLEFLKKIKALGISQGTLGNEVPNFYTIVDGVLQENSVGEFAAFSLGTSSDPVEQRIAVKGNPNFGDIRTLMVGVKNISGVNQCAEVWFNELRLADLDNEGGWAAIMSMDSNVADFMNVNATAKRSTTGFGSLEQGPNERSREDLKQYDLVTNMNIGQLLPKKWGLEIPFNYGQSEALITPEFDQQYKDLKLQSRLDAATSSEERERIKTQSEDYTKRQSINFIGVRKQRTGDAKPRVYDVENLTMNYSYNGVEHRDFEIENSLDQNVRVGANYNYSFNPLKLEPFKKNDSLFMNKYWKLLKEFNLNLLPSSLSVNSDYVRQFNSQKFRDADLGARNITVDELIRRNYTFDFQYTVNYDITDALRLNFTASNNNIVRNYFIDDELNGDQDPNLGVWDRFFDFGDPNRHTQQLGINYTLPLNKFPALSFVTSNYSYIGDFQWNKGSDLLVGNNTSLGNSISNASQHNLNTSFDMRKLYRYLGVKTNSRRRSSKAKKFNLKNFGLGLLTGISRVQVNYSESNSSFLPGYLPTPGFLGTLRPTAGYTFGSQRDIRRIAAENGWLTTFAEFNQQYTETYNQDIDFSINMEPISDLKIDLNGGKTLATNFTESFNAVGNTYNSLSPNTFGNYNISTILIKTAFSQSDELKSVPFEEFKSNRLVIANRLAQNFYGANGFSTDAEGYPEGFGKNSQAVLLPSFLAAYSGEKSNKTSLDAIRDIPLPNWTLKYTGLMKNKWFKKRFRRFSMTHGYNASYTINQFRSNLDYTAANPNLDYGSQSDETKDQSGNYKVQTLYSNINLVEQFSPLVKIDFEMKNSVKVSAEIKKDRSLSLSFDNNLLTEIHGDEYVFGLGYRIKDLRIRSKLAGARKIIKSDLNMKADISMRDNKTVIRYLDLDSNQVSAGQTIWSIRYAADYAFSKNLTAIFFFDYAFSEYAISTAFPQTSIRSGFTLRYNFGN